MLVSDVMTEEVVTVPIDGTLGDAVGRMLDLEIGSVIVTRDGDPAGIVTETDVLISVHGSGKPLEAIPMEAAMSHPLVTVAPGTTVRTAAERMRAERVKKLPVFEGMELVGILTQEDIVHAHPQLVREAVHHEERRTEWDEEAEDR